MADYYGPAYGPGFAKDTSQTVAPNGQPYLGPGYGSSYVPPTSPKAVSNPYNQPASNNNNGGGGGGSQSKFNPSAVWDSKTGKTFQSAFQEGLIDEYGNSLSGQRNAAAEEARRREEQLRGTINSQWDSVFGYLDKVSGYLPEQYDLQKGQIENLATGQQQQLEGQKQQADQKIEGYRTEVKDNQESSLRDLAQNMRNQYQAGNIYLGANGAGNSSATDRYAFALQKAGNKTRSNVLLGTNKQLNDLNLKAADVDTTFNTQMNQLGTWKNDKLAELGLWYNDQKQQLDYQRANASGQKAQALANLDAQLYNTAVSRLGQIESAAQNWQQAVTQWKLDRSAQLQDQIAYYSGASAYNPSAVSGGIDAGISYAPSAVSPAPTSRQISTSQLFGGAGSTVQSGNAEEDKARQFLFG